MCKITYLNLNLHNNQIKLFPERAKLTEKLVEIEEKKVKILEDKSKEIRNYHDKKIQALESMVDIIKKKFGDSN